MSNGSMQKNPVYVTDSTCCAVCQKGGVFKCVFIIVVYFLDQLIMSYKVLYLLNRFSFCKVQGLRFMCTGLAWVEFMCHFSWGSKHKQPLNNSNVLLIASIHACSYIHNDTHIDCVIEGILFRHTLFY